MDREKGKRNRNREDGYREGERHKEKDREREICKEPVVLIWSS